MNNVDSPNEEHSITKVLLPLSRTLYKPEVIFSSTLFQGYLSSAVEIGLFWTEICHLYVADFDGDEVIVHYQFNIPFLFLFNFCLLTDK